jgi:hypothetical protein
VLHIVTVSASVNTKICTSEEAKKLHQQFNSVYCQERLLIVLINPNDCGYCLSSLSFLKNPIKYTKTVYLSTTFLNSKQIEAFRKNYSIDSSITVEHDKDKMALLRKQNADLGKSASMVILMNGNIFSYLKLKEYGQYLNLKTDVDLTNLTSLSQDNYFFSTIGSIAQSPKGSFAIAYPKADIVYFNSKGKYIDKLELDSSDLRYIFNQNLRFQSMELKGLNNFDSMMETYNNVLKPMGFNTLQAEHLFNYNNEVWAIIIGKMPMKDSPTNVRFEGQRILVKLVVDDDGKLLISKKIVFRDENISNPNGWFIYSANHFSMSSEDSVFIGFGSGKDSGMRSNSAHIFEQFVLKDDEMVDNGLVELFTIPEVVYSYNDKLGNLAFITKKLNNSEDSEIYYKHLPYFKIK